MTTTQTTSESIAIPLAGLTEAQVKLAFGGGELALGQAEPGMLVSGTFEGGVIQKTPAPGRIEIQPLEPARAIVTWRPLRWHVGLTAEIPVDLRLESGANRSTIDLRSLRVRRLEIHTGASETNVQLPTYGQTTVLISCGFASVNVEVPTGVAARIRGTVAIGATTVDEARFPRGEQGWVSADFETARNRVDIAVEGGFGSVRVF